ncbi:MAG: NAD(P)/FAD-dependent oxidoreductase [Clostridia bacterium]|nr:NAD(P)/FAD-dependent oxidoreductase [Clostridia bacterium]
MKRYVIIGNGVAAAGCIEGIRSRDNNGEITVVSEERHAVYCRPLISYYLEKKTDPERMRYRGADFYEQNGVRVLYGEKAEAIDAQQKTVRLKTGDPLRYDALCVAAGSSPFVPRFDGIGTVEKQFSFLTLDDAFALEKAICQDTSVLIVGAGLIGLKCAEGLHGRVREITVCDLSDRVLSSILDAKRAAAVQRRLEGNGIRFLLGNSVKRFDRHTALMQNGERVPFDVLVLAVGVKPNRELILEAGGDVNRGVCIDDKMQTSLPAVYAAGDCTEGTDVSLGEKRVLAILPNAYLQGFTAGVNMAGGDAVFDRAIPMNAIGFFGLHLMTAGTYAGEAYEETDEEGSKTLFIKDGFLKGFILIGKTERAGLYTSLIREQVPLDQIDFELMKKSATSAAFSAQKRKTMFGGVTDDAN